MGLTIERKKSTRRKKIPESFIYEIMDGKPLYYKGHKWAIRNNLNAESIMEASTLRVLIIEYLLSILFSVINRKPYRIFSGRVYISIIKII